MNSTLKLIRGIQEPNTFFVESNYGMLLFDNGAATTQLPISKKTEALTTQGTYESHGIFGTKKQDKTVVERLCVGDIVAEKIPVRLDDTIGLLGSDILKNYAYTFDITNLEVKFIEPFISDIQCKVGKKNHFYIPIEICGENKAI